MQTRTKRQHEVLEYITDFINQRGYEPSYQQIARAIGVRSKGAIAKHIEALEKQGLISRKHENGSFSIDLIPQDSLTNSVCRIDWICDNASPDESIESKDPFFLPKSILGASPRKRLSAFLVTDDSMLDEHICAGDIALIEERAFARDRDRVVALIDKKGAVLNRFYRQGANIELRPSNDKYEAIIVPADQIEIIGVFRGLLRPLS